MKNIKIYKEKQFLIFDFENGKTVKYDFSTKTTIGLKGLPVKNLKSQLSGYDLDELMDYFTDKKYAKFLKFVRRNESSHFNIYNIGTILERVPKYKNFEQIFSAGIEDIVDKNFKYTINDIPKVLIKMCKNHEIRLGNLFLDLYNENPNGYQLAYNLDYASLNDNDINSILIKYKNGGYNYQIRDYDKGYGIFNKLINEFGYTSKALLLYLDQLKTFEALDDMYYLLGELYDYATMMSKISKKFNKYPRHFLTTHKIACRNYNRLKEQFDEEIFKKQIDKSLEFTYKNYTFIYPNCTQDIKDEAVSQNNCVASYIDKVIKGECHILFLRNKDCVDKSLVTIEIRNNQIVQAKRKFNDPVNKDEQQAIDAWNKKFNIKKEKIA